MLRLFTLSLAAVVGGHQDAPYGKTWRLAPWPVICADPLDADLAAALVEIGAVAPTADEVRLALCAEGTAALASLATPVEDESLGPLGTLALELGRTRDGLLVRGRLSDALDRGLKGLGARPLSATDISAVPADARIAAALTFAPEAAAAFGVVGSSAVWYVPYGREADGVVVTVVPLTPGEQTAVETPWQRSGDWLIRCEDDAARADALEVLMTDGPPHAGLASLVGDGAFFAAWIDSPALRSRVRLAAGTVAVHRVDSQATGRSDRRPSSASARWMGSAIDFRMDLDSSIQVALMQESGGATLGVLSVTFETLARGRLPQLVLPGYKTSDKRAHEDLTAILKASSFFVLNNGGRWPDSLDLLVLPDENGRSYLRGPDLPLDPWGRPYHYEQAAEGGLYPVLCSYGADGKPGGAGDVADIHVKQ